MQLAAETCIEEVVDCFLYKNNYWVITRLMENDLEKLLTAC